MAGLTIAFIGCNAFTTSRAFRQFSLDNVEQVTRYDGTRGRMTLRDGTEIVMITPGFFKTTPDGWRFDQVILADRWWRDILRLRREEINNLEYRCQMSAIPAELRYMIYDMDAEVQTDGKE